jgi:hypothetical protein
MKGHSVAKYITEEVQAALKPISSLITKSEKARQKLTPGTWQHTMLGDNLAALQIASALIVSAAAPTNSYRRDDLQKALQAIASMIGKAEKARAMFSPGTSQHTLQRNRLKALGIAEALIMEALDGRNA